MGVGVPLIGGLANWGSLIGVHESGFANCDSLIRMCELGRRVAKCGFANWAPPIGIHQLGFANWDARFGNRELGFAKSNSRIGNR